MLEDATAIIRERELPVGADVLLELVELRRLVADRLAVTDAFDRAGLWEHGGETSLPNLVLLCSRHHHLIHRPGWHAKLLPDATWPDGRTGTTSPPLLR